MKTKIEKKINISKLKDDLINAVKSKDPMQKWVPVLNEIKAEIVEAKSKGISISNIKKIMSENGVKVPQDILKKFLGISDKK